jgi:uncharacterized protein with HEPN domain
MLDAAQTAISHVRDMTEDQFLLDRSKQDAVVYRIGVIGEAARHVSDETKSLPALNWSAMMGMRNRVFHGYRDVRVSVVWTTVTDDLPEIIATLERYLAP